MEKLGVMFKVDKLFLWYVHICWKGNWYRQKVCICVGLKLLSENGIRD